MARVYAVIVGLLLMLVGLLGLLAGFPAAKTAAG